MENDLKIKVVNFEEELKSFPLQQSIYLETSAQLEDSLLESNIVLLRETQEYGLLNTADLYNYNIGYVKERYDTVPLAITLSEESGKHRVKITPKETLHPSSRYALFVDKDLTYEHIELEKDVSKGPSQLVLVDSENNTLDLNDVYRLKVSSKPYITSTSNVVKFTLYINNEVSRHFTINAKDTSKNLIRFAGITVRVLDVAYGEGEEFVVVRAGIAKPLKENLIVQIFTVLSSKIKPVENINPSQGISNQDVIDYYESLDQKQVTKEVFDTRDPEQVKKHLVLEYVGYDKVLLHIREPLTIEDLDLDNLSFRTFPAFNRYDLTDLNLYDEEIRYYVDYEEIDESTLLLVFKEE